MPAVRRGLSVRLRCVHALKATTSRACVCLCTRVCVCVCVIYLSRTAQSSSLCRYQSVEKPSSGTPGVKPCSNIKRSTPPTTADTSFFFACTRDSSTYCITTRGNDTNPDSFHRHGREQLGSSDKGNTALEIQPAIRQIIGGLLIAA